MRASVGMGDMDTSSSSDDDDSGISGHTKRWVSRKKQNRQRRITNGLRKDGEAEDGATIIEDDRTLKEDQSPEMLSSASPSDVTGIAMKSIEMQISNQDIVNQPIKDGDRTREGKKMSFQLSALSKQAAGAVMSGGLGGLEQNMPADAVLAKEGVNEVSHILSHC